MVEQTGPVIDVRDPERVLAAIEDASRRFEKGGRVPNATRQLLVELADALADSGPLELGISARRWVRAVERARRAVESLRDDRVEVQVRDAKQGLGAARRALRLAAWSAGWRKQFGESRRALWIQFATLWLLAALVVVLVETVFLPGGFRLIYLAVAPVVLCPIWFLFFEDIRWPLIDAALAREAARVVADGQRALLVVRLAGDKLLIATDQEVLGAGRLLQRRWALTSWAPYTQITSFASDEKAKPPSLRLGIRGRERVLVCRQISRGETPHDYQRKRRNALLTILYRRTAQGQGRGGHEPDVQDA